MDFADSDVQFMAHSGADPSGGRPVALKPLGPDV